MIALSDLRTFEQRHLKLEARSADDVRRWISEQHAGVQAMISGESSDGPVALLSRAQIDDLALVLYRYNIELSGRFSEDFDAYFFCIPLSGSSRRICPQNGEIIQRSDQVLIYRRTAGLVNFNSHDYTNLSLIVPTDLLEQHLRAHTHVPISSMISFAPLLDINSGPGQAVVNLVSYLLSQLVSLEAPFSNPISNASLKSYLTTVLLSSVPHNYSDALNTNAVPVPRTVKRAEEYMRARCTEAITIEELAKVAGCSPRALHAAFKSFRDTTPMSVHCDFRLEAAHEEIAKDLGTVSDIAVKYGFSNVGRFAKQYALKFGQKPSQTRLIGLSGQPISTNRQPASSFTG